jgi:predicted O-methyltransferase YrrM
VTAATTTLDERLYAYYRQVGLREHPVLARLREATDRLAEGSMRSSAEQAQLLAFLIELTGARHVLEVGCFTGYTALAMALALPPDGRLTTLDVNDDWTSLGRRHWQEAGVADRIDLRLGLAQDSLRTLQAEGAIFDLVYIDADKKTYPTYYDLALTLTHQGSIIAFDNVLWHGAVADPDDHYHQTETLRRLNANLHADERVSLVMLPLGDGLTLLRVR